MPTTIQIKKSGATGNAPLNASLEYGELALNYADGILYFKNAANQIQQISGTAANTFETINANGSLLIADSNVDILSIAAGSGINITANTTTDTLTIAARLNDTVTSTDTTQIATANSVKTAYDQASSAYNAANNAAVTVKANAGPTIIANTINFNNSATVNVTVTQDGTTANISFGANAVNISSINSNQFTGNASCTQFILTSSNFSTNGIFVFIDGVTQVPTVDYNLAGATLTFVVPPANNSFIEVRSFQNISVGTASIRQGNTTLLVSDSSYSFNANGFSVSTDAINRQYLLRGTTTNSTETELFLFTGDRIPVSTNTTMFYTADIVARRTDAINESAGFYIKGVVDNFSGTVADVGDLYEVVVAEDDPSILVDARADDTNNTINIYATGAAGKTIRWTALVKTVEVAQ
jgi:hypothetical protein